MFGLTISVIHFVLAAEDEVPFELFDLAFPTDLALPGGLDVGCDFFLLICFQVSFEPKNHTRNDLIAKTQHEQSLFTVYGRSPTSTTIRRIVAVLDAVMAGQTYSNGFFSATVILACPPLSCCDCAKSIVQNPLCEIIDSHDRPMRNYVESQEKSVTGQTPLQGLSSVRVPFLLGGSTRPNRLRQFGIVEFSSSCHRRTAWTTMLVPDS